MGERKANERGRKKLRKRAWKLKVKEEKKLTRNGRNESERGKQLSGEGKKEEKKGQK